MNKIGVLDRGYVILHDVMGSDLTVVNAARASYNKKSDELTDRDVRLIKYLANHGHTSPFRHATLQFEIYAPLMVARQHWKYVIGSSTIEATGDNMTAWNESSRRYVTEEPEFYVPETDEWRSAPENSKQGSGAPINDKLGTIYTGYLTHYINLGKSIYEDALKDGVAPELARLFLPAYGMYVRYYWTASLQAVAHFINQRIADDAQREIYEYAKAVYELALPKFPVSLGELVTVNVNDK